MHRWIEKINTKILTELLLDSEIKKFIVFCFISIFWFFYSEYNYCFYKKKIFILMVFLKSLKTFSKVTLPSSLPLIPISPRQKQPMFTSFLDHFSTIQCVHTSICRKKIFFQNHTKWNLNPRSQEGLAAEEGNLRLVLSYL